jgi:hypothetical protein
MQGSVAASPAAGVKMIQASTVHSTASKRSYSSMIDKQACFAIHVKPRNPGTHAAEGVILVPMAFADKPIADVMYMRKGTPSKNIFFKQTQCVHKRVSALYEGTLMQRMWQGVGYPRNAICVMLNHKTTEADVRNYVENTFAPSVMALPSHNLREAQSPVLRPGQDYIVVDTWDEALDDMSDIKFCIQSVVENFGGWLRGHKDHVYQVWKDGQVPLDAMFMYSLNGTHMSENDSLRHVAYLQQQADEQVQELAADEASMKPPALGEHKSNNDNA